MNQYAVVQTDLGDSAEAGTLLGNQVKEALGGSSPDAFILFASPKYDFPSLLKAIDAACAPRTLAGCSSAGEFTSDTRGEGFACALAIRSSEMQFAVGIGRGLSADPAGAAAELCSSFRGISSYDKAYRSALVLTDALAGHTEELVDHLTLRTGGTYQFFGGGAGDNAEFRRTEVFAGMEAVSDAVVALEILSEKPLGVGVRHGWEPASEPFRVTESQQMRLVSLNAAPAVEVFAAHAEATEQQFDPADPLPFFLHNIIGIQSGNDFKLRVPLSVAPDGSVLCAAAVPSGATVRIMRPAASASEAGALATRSAIAKLNGHQPRIALFFDCVATRLRMGKDFGFELDTVAQALSPAEYLGCNTHGQIARAEGQFGGFHNCTAVVCVFPE